MTDSTSPSSDDGWTVVRSKRPMPHKPIPSTTLWDVLTVLYPKDLYVTRSTKLQATGLLTSAWVEAGIDPRHPMIKEFNDIMQKMAGSLIAVSLDVHRVMHYVRFWSEPNAQITKAQFMCAVQDVLRQDDRKEWIEYIEDRVEVFHEYVKGFERTYPGGPWFGKCLDLLKKEEEASRLSK